MHNYQTARAWHNSLLIILKSCVHVAYTAVFSYTANRKYFANMARNLHEVLGIKIFLPQMGRLHMACHLCVLSPNPHPGRVPYEAH